MEVDINLIFEMVEEFKEVINCLIKKVFSLCDIMVVNFFFENFIWMWIFFELVEKCFLVDVVNFFVFSFLVKKGEILFDIVNNIFFMKVDMVVMWYLVLGVYYFLLCYIGVNIINVGDGIYEYFIQVLLDVFFMWEQIGDLVGKNIVIIGDILYLWVVLSNIFCFIKFGVNVCVCGLLMFIFKYIVDLGVLVFYDI